MVKNPANAEVVRDAGLILGSGSSPGEGNGNPLQYSRLENSMDRGAWRATVHEVATEQLTSLHFLDILYLSLHGGLWGGDPRLCAADTRQRESI